MINYGNKILDMEILIKQIVLFFLIQTLFVTHVANANKINTTNSSRTAAQGSVSIHMTPPAPPSPTPSPSSHLFAWGHVTKYSTILFHEDVVVKGSKTLNVKYPPEDDFNDFAIIGIYADNFGPTASLDVSASIVEGGIGYNFTTIRFVSQSLHEYQYNVIIYGVDV